MTPEAITKAETIIKQFEGCRLVVYKDPVGILTCGVGHRVYPADGLVLGQRVTQEQADAFLGHDLQAAEWAVGRFVTVALNDNQAAALLSLCFNIGPGNFQHSSLVRELNAGNYDVAAEAFLQWNRAGGRVLDGLTRRRQAEHDLFKTA